MAVRADDEAAPEAAVAPASGLAAVVSTDWAAPPGSASAEAWPAADTAPSGATAADPVDAADPVAGPEGAGCGDVAPGAPWALSVAPARMARSRGSLALKVAVTRTPAAGTSTWNMWVVAAAAG